MVFTEIGALENCENLEESFGEICVHCNKCGRFNKKNTKKDANVKFNKEQLDEMFDDYFKESEDK